MDFHSTAFLLFILLAGFSPVTSSPLEARVVHTIRARENQPRCINDDPTDPGWIKDYAAIGDSYSAGIGAGNVLTGPGDSECSRYDGAYSEIVNEILGPGQRKYKFVACSGVSLKIF